MNKILRASQVGASDRRALDPDVPVRSLGLTRRVENALVRNGILNLSDLHSLSEQDVFSLRNLGASALGEIRSKAGGLTEVLSLHARLAIELGELRALLNGRKDLGTFPTSMLGLPEEIADRLLASGVATLEQLARIQPSSHFYFGTLRPGSCALMLRAVKNFRDFPPCNPEPTGVAWQEPGQRPFLKIEAGATESRAVLDRTLTAEAKELTRVSRGWVISGEDPRLGHLVRSISGDAGSTLDIANRLLARSQDPPDPQDLARQVQNVRRQIERLCAMPLEDELRDLLQAGQSRRHADTRDRTTQIVTRYLGWDGTGPRTLEKVGEEFGLTRERIRQVSGLILGRLRGREIFTPILDKVLDFVRARVPKVADEIEGALVDAGLTRNVFRLDGVERAADVCGRKTAFRVAQLGAQRLVLPLGPPNLQQSIAQIARKSVQHWGVATIADVAAQASDRSGRRIEETFVLSALGGLPDFHWLDEQAGWFWLSSVSRNRLLNTLRKIVSVAPRISTSDLRVGVARHHRMQGSAPPQRVLLALCRQLPGCEVQDQLVIADPAPEWRKVLAPVERTIVRILMEKGPVMERAELEQCCLDAGINRSTFYVYLDYSPVVERYARGVYGLRGAKIGPSVVESLIRKTRRSRVLKDYGWVDDGNIWLGYRISESMISSGVFGIPSSIKPWLKGDFDLKASDGASVGTVVSGESGAWGLGPFFRRRGGEPGDYLAMLFDLGNRQVTVSIGDETLMDNF